MSGEFWDQVIYALIVLAKIAGIMIVLILSVAYYTYAARQVIGRMQVRPGPNRVGFFRCF